MITHAWSQRARASLRMERLWAATHAVVASLVVLILGFYVDGEFRQEGTLWRKKIQTLISTVVAWAAWLTIRLGAQAYSRHSKSHINNHIL